MQGGVTASGGVRLDPLITTFEIPSEAMDPTLQKGMAAVVDRFHYAREELERWHVILFILSYKEFTELPQSITFKDHAGSQRTLSRPHFPFAKRVVGLPGETLRFTPSSIVCNGKELTI